MRPIVILTLVALAGCSSADLVVVGSDDAVADAAEGAVDTASSEDTTAAADSGEADTTEATDTAPASDTAPIDATPDAGLDAGGDAVDAGDDADDDEGIDAHDGGLDAMGDASEVDAVVDAPPDAADASCDTPLHCYWDRDGDGFVASAGAVDACVCPSGTKTISATGTLFDCSDEDPAVHPGAGYHDTAYCVPGTGCATKSFDYDCSGVEDKEVAVTFGGCSAFSAGCVGAGWQTGVAECGGTNNFVTCSKALISCNQAVAARLQRCR